MSELSKFLFEGLPVRGMVVRLTDAWVELLARRAGLGAHEPAVRALLGEMSVAALLMQANIKFDGALVLQLHGDGPVKLAVAEAQPELTFRATAKVVGAVSEGAGLEALLNVRGQGRCAITLDPRLRKPGQQPYQGVVPLHGDRREPLQQLAQVIEHYMLQSEQLDTRLVLAADDRVAAGLLIQRLPLPGAGLRDEDEIGRNEDFNRIALLAATLTREELLQLPPRELLRRLFHEETLRLFPSQQPRFACSCSRERVAGMLRGLGREEIEALIAERGEAEVGCDFCGLQYRFDPIDAAGLFQPVRDRPPASSGLQ
ncbi:MAG: Hsp33 family molecular chaperone HslO [Burkholderiales bacterium]|nr:Hsp33 family molecular chaperone HslO [Burkholderiales bacterium]MDE1929556.1 Hsp33 family molecular chaperone HslO [Burkholderiales bacterium]MDE2158713.1 Hsp33 family molecular chaperone HslO [Burkholderiales bacterium]MDE2505159.1 Hsp33 family molecular chaperone HslO [Burkholderiales bacterium]